MSTINLTKIEVDDLRNEMLDTIIESDLVSPQRSEAVTPPPELGQNPVFAITPSPLGINS
jgi:hypothetical protein